ncbi:MAG: hypothetical protein OXN17_00010 [Candidatus Poribacteria bacterium]|nr:hypothetical protein [Candidatus Poribacteria bacterium]MDE0504971.1 hypothetical protein [Candidatus Poribacteria bacterium]
MPRTVSDGRGGAIVAWEDYRTGTDWDVYAQRVSSAGKAIWKVDGVPICTAGWNQRRLRMTRSSDRVIAVWNDRRDRSNWDIYAQAIDVSGKILWQSDGVPVCTDSADQSTQAILSDGAGGAIFVWEDARRSAQYQDLYIQRLGPDGHPMWKVDGVPVFPSESLQSDPILIGYGEVGFYIVWWDVIGYESWHIMVTRFAMNGSPVWNNPIVVTPPEGMHGIPLVTTDHDGGLIIAWQIYEDFINDNLYAQRIDSNGKKLWADEGVKICDAAGIQKSASIASDGNGGLIAVWSDERDVYSDLYAQRVGAFGAVRWKENGVPVSTAGGHQDKPFIVPSTDNQFFVAWLDYREDYGDESSDAIYAQQFNLAGEVAWKVDGVPICTAPGEQYPPFVLRSQSGDIILVWTDVRDDQGDVYMWKF